MRRAAWAGPITAVGAHPPSTRRMVMSGSAMLAPREDSDSAVGQEAAGDAAGEKAVDRYRTWVGDHRVSAALLAGPLSAAPAPLRPFPPPPPPPPPPSPHP